MKYAALLDALFTKRDLVPLRKEVALRNTLLDIVAEWAFDTVSLPPFDLVHVFLTSGSAGGWSDVGTRCPAKTTERLGSRMLTDDRSATRSAPTTTRGWDDTIRISARSISLILSVLQPVHQGVATMEVWRGEKMAIDKQVYLSLTFATLTREIGMMSTVSRAATL